MREPNWAEMKTTFVGDRSLPVAMTERERDDMAKKAAQHGAEARRLLKRCDQAKKDLATLKKDYDDAVVLGLSASEVWESGKEIRPVPVEVVFDPYALVKYSVRIDDGVAYEAQSVSSADQLPLGPHGISEGARQAIKKRLIGGALVQLETGDNESTMAAEIKVRIHSVEGGLTLAEAVSAYNDQGAREKAERTCLALINLDEIKGQWPIEPGGGELVLRAAYPILVHDMARMVELYPDLEVDENWDPGNEANFEAIFAPVPLAEAVRDYAHVPALGPDIGKISEFFARDGEEVVATEDAAHWCVAAAWLERYALHDHPDIMRYWPPIGADDDNLREVYWAVTGDDPGKKKSKTLRDTIEEHKAIAVD